MNHTCFSEKVSLGSPILKISNNKVVGMNEGSNKENNLGIFIKYTINDFNINKKLSEFNINYNLNIKNMDVTKLYINRKWIGDKGLKDLCENMQFIKIKELNLRSNNLSDIKVLEKVKYEKLEKLYLGVNEISNNIYILENVDFKQLKELDLSGNNIF